MASENLGSKSYFVIFMESEKLNLVMLRFIAYQGL